MANISNVNFQMALVVLETLDLALDNAANPIIQHKTDLSSGAKTNLSASTTVPATKAWSDTFTIADGVSTELDLTSLTANYMPSDVVTFNGLKLQLLLLEAAAANTVDVTVTVGAADGLDFLGDASDQITLKPGARCMFYMADQTEDVDATHKQIDFDCSGDTADVSIIMVAG